MTGPSMEDMACRDGGLTECDLVELTNQTLRASAGVDGILPQTEVRKHFPNLYPTSNEASRYEGPRLLASATRWPKF